MSAKNKIPRSQSKVRSCGWNIESTMLSSYFAINGRAVLRFFNPVRTEQFMANYIITARSVNEHDEYSTKCLHSIYFVMITAALIQILLFLFPGHGLDLMLFNMVDESNDYPNLFKINTAAMALMFAYMYYMLYDRTPSESVFAFLSDSYLYDSHTFITTSTSEIKKLIINSLTFYQVFTLFLSKSNHISKVSINSNYFSVKLKYQKY